MRFLLKDGLVVVNSQKGAEYEEFEYFHVRTFQKLSVHFKLILGNSESD